jgi:hypothetical protein
MLTVSVRYRDPFSTTDAGDIAVYLTDLLRSNPTADFYLIVLPNRTLAVGAPKGEKYERWQVKELRYIRDEKFRPYFLTFSPSELPQGEYATIMYGGIRGKVEREHPSAPLYFYLTEAELPLREWETKAGATKEAVWEIFKVNAKDGVATIRPLLSDSDLMWVWNINEPSVFNTINALADFIGDVLTH